MTNKRLTPQQLKDKRIRELLRAIRRCRYAETRKIYKEHLEFIKNQAC